MQQNKKVSWEDLYFLAESCKDAFREVYLITAKCVYVNAIEERVIDQRVKDKDFKTLELLNTSRWQSYVKDAVKNNAFNKRVYVSEYVEIQPTHITVCLNRETVDEEFIAEAIDRLSTALDQLDGEYGRVAEGKKYFFTVKDIPWLNTH